MSAIAPVAERIEPTKFEKIASRTLVVTAVASAALSLITPLRVIGSLALRTSSLFSTLLDFKQGQTLAKIALLIPGVLGLVGVILAKTGLVVASLAIDAGVRVVKAIRHFVAGRNFEGGQNLLVMAINAFAIAAITTCSWPFMIAAGVTSIGLVVLNVAKLRGNGNWTEILANVALGWISLIGTIQALRIESTRVDRTVFDHRNDSDKQLIVHKRVSEKVVISPARVYYENRLVQGCESGPTFERVRVYVPEVSRMQTRAVPLHAIAPGKSFHTEVSGPANLFVGEASLDGNIQFARPLAPTQVDTSTSVFQPRTPDQYTTTPLVNGLPHLTTDLQ